MAIKFATPKAARYAAPTRCPICGRRVPAYEGVCGRCTAARRPRNPDEPPAALTGGRRIA